MKRRSTFKVLIASLFGLKLTPVRGAVTPPSFVPVPLNFYTAELENLNLIHGIHVKASTADDYEHHHEHLRSHIRFAEDHRVDCDAIRDHIDAHANMIGCRLKPTYRFTYSHK